MCVICVKPKEADFPSKEVLFNMFRRNSDGAGFMYVKDGKVKIQKGFMHFKSFYRAFRKANIPKDATAVFHFRIATSGSKSPGNTHPFPITEDISALKSTSTVADFGLAHNGILSYGFDKENDLSDTMTFIREVLADDAIISSVFRPQGHALVEEAIGTSKMAIMRNDGTIALLGDWVVRKDDANDKCVYSNLFFTPVISYNTTSKTDDKKKDNVTVLHHSYNNKNTKSLGYDRDSIVEIQNSTKECPRCKHPIQDPTRQIACHKCGIFFDNLEAGYSLWN